jgi:3-deoxy-manno-octulosonate cytidylyltransferase (CMP-KDO synthetase)
MIQYVYERARRASILDDVIVATDDLRIKEAVERFGGKAIMTSSKHSTGTDRIGEIVKNLDVEIVINIQGDEPLIDPKLVDEVGQALLEDPGIEMATLVHEIVNKEDFANPNVTKAVLDRNGFALYFSRSLIPYPRKKVGCPVYEHIGIYAYRKDFLLKYIRLQPTPLERTESLEQLRALEYGYKIKVIVTEKHTSLGVDTKEDLEKVKAFLRQDS